MKRTITHHRHDFELTEQPVLVKGKRMVIKQHKCKTCPLTQAYDLTEPS